MIDSKIKGESGVHISGGWHWMKAQYRRTGHLDGVSGVAHIFGLNTLASVVGLFSVSPVLVLVPLSVLNSTYSWSSIVDLIVKSPNRSLWCSSLPVVPMCVAISHHRVCWSVRGSLSPSAPDDHMRSMSVGSSASAAFGLFPLPSVFRCFRAAFSASCDAVNFWSQRMLYGCRRSRVRCLSMLLWKDVCIGLVECTVLPPCCDKEVSKKPVEFSLWNIFYLSTFSMFFTPFVPFSNIIFSFALVGWVAWVSKKVSHSIYAFWLVHTFTAHHGN